MKTQYLTSTTWQPFKDACMTSEGLPMPSAVVWRIMSISTSVTVKYSR
ncbi:hypothetical protein [Aliamphritea spongicola]|nr:hypothetical protein [Aliamphritea spongicola]